MLVTWSAAGPPYISAHAYWVVYWPAGDVTSTRFVRHVTTDVTRRYVDGLRAGTLYNFRVFSFFFSFFFVGTHAPKAL